MSELYSEEDITVTKYTYDLEKIKSLINDYLSKNVLKEYWGEEIYSRTVKCISVNHNTWRDKDYLEISLMYTDTDLENCYIDEDLPYCKEFRAFLSGIDVPCSVSVPSCYYAK